jgi:hypothetical protein
MHSAAAQKALCVLAVTKRKKKAGQTKISVTNL